MNRPTPHLERPSDESTLSLATPGVSATDTGGARKSAAVRRPLPLRFGIVLNIAITIAIALVSAALLIRPLETQQQVIIGASDRGIVTGFHEAEFSASEGRPFRWTTAEASLRLSARGLTDHALALRLAAPPGVSAIAPPTG